MEDTFGIRSNRNVFKEPVILPELPKGLLEFSKPNKNVHFETPSYMDQLANRHEDGTIIPMGSSVSTPLTKNVNSDIDYIYFQGNHNAYEKPLPIKEPSTDII